MGVVRVRFSEEDESWLRQRGVKPGAFAKQAVHEAIRREEIREAREFLDRNRIMGGRPSEVMVREDRDAR